MSGLAAFGGQQGLRPAGGGGGVYTVAVELGDGSVEQVQVDPVEGPIIHQADGNTRFFSVADNGWDFNKVGCRDVRQHSKKWSSLGSTEQKIILDIAARKNKKLAEWEQASGGALPQKSALPDFLANWSPVSFSLEDQQRYFAEMSAPPQEEVVTSGGQAPVLVVFYSGGMTKPQGFELVRDFLDAARAKGLTDQVVLHHAEGYDIEGEGTGPWPEYISRLIDEIDGDPARRGRPLLLWGHSKGATPAMSLAARLGDRVLKVYCVASGAPTPGEVSPFQKMAESFKRGTDLDLLKWFCSLNADRALHRMVEACDKGELTVESSPYLQGKLTLMKKQYVNTIYPDMERDFAVIAAPIMAVWPKLDETCPQAVMEAWGAWTSAKCDLRPITAGHMDVLKTTEHHGHICEDMVRTARAAAAR